MPKLDNLVDDLFDFLPPLTHMNLIKLNKFVKKLIFVK
jgi:hypothetical protein